MADKLLHESPSAGALYGINVALSMVAYLTVFFEGFLVPFQVSKMPRSWGPNWIYVLTVFMGQLEYFLWPLEMNAYLFKTNEEKVQLLRNPENISRWQKKTKSWGSVFSGLGLGVGAVSLTLKKETLQYVKMPWFYAGAYLVYGLQNWAFLYYLDIVKDSDSVLNF